jgi:hypothetical protein
MTDDVDEVIELEDPINILFVAGPHAGKIMVHERDTTTVSVGFVDHEAELEADGLPPINCVEYLIRSIPTTQRGITMKCFVSMPADDDREPIDALIDWAFNRKR